MTEGQVAFFEEGDSRSLEAVSGVTAPLLKTVAEVDLLLTPSVVQVNSSD